MDDPFVGRIIADRYRIVESIGAGGMADVYRGEHIQMRKRVAIKVLNPATERLPELVARFEREAIAGAQVHHPNVAIATDFGKMDDGSFYLVLEYIRGKTLRNELDELRTLPAPRAALVAMQVAAALGAAHDAGVVHRDLKPANVMLVEGERDFVKLIDFGFAKVDEARLSTTPGDAPFGRPLTGIGQMFGTPPYMAPESIGGMDAVDSRSDLYSLGVLLYEMLCGRRPFEVEDRVELFGRKANEAAPPLSLFAEHVPEELEAITMRLLEREPSSRFANAHEVEEALRPLTVIPSIAPVPTPSLPPEASDAPPAPSATRRSLGPLAFGLAVGLVLVIGVGVVVRKLAGRAPPPPNELVAPSSAPAIEASAAPSSEPAAASPRAELWKAVAKHDPRRGAQAVIALADVEPAAFREPDVIAAAANLAATMDALDAGVANTMFDLFSQKLGAEGVDVLFELVRTRGAERGPGKRAMDLLRDERVVSKASPALRVLLELRAAPCPRKRELFERAATEGDARMLLELRSLRGSPCPKRAGPCCFKTDKPLYDAIATLKARVGGLATRRVHDFGRYVAAAGQVRVQRSERVDDSPGDAPPAEEQRNERVRQRLAERAFAGTEEVDGRASLERHDENRDRVFEHHELRAPRELALDLLVRQALHAADRHTPRLPMNLVLASQEAKVARDRVTHAAWGMRLSVDQYLVREQRLRAHPWAAAGMETWLLVDDAGEVLASCESFAATSRLRGEDGTSYAIASVYTEPHLRGRGLATSMMDRVAETLSARADTHSIILFSDVGAPIYERSGYVVVPSFDRVLSAEAGDIAEGVVPFGERDLAACLPAAPVDQPYVIWPSAAQIDWHLERERIYAELLSRPRCQHVGARAGAGVVVWATDFKNDRLMLLLLVATDARELSVLARSAQRVAASLGLAEVRVWDEPGIATLAPTLGTVEPREGGLTMIRSAAKGLVATDLRSVPRALWV